VRDVREVVREMLAFRDREGPTLGGKATAREPIEEGRHFLFTHTARIDTTMKYTTLSE
jgi:hypothetical protein